MKFVQFVNSLLKDTISRNSNLVVYGQNVHAGSCLSGLTRGVSDLDGVIAKNSQNSENMLVGNGFGMMLSGVSSIFFMKQLDFLLLGIDHLVNTYNIVRQQKTKSSFTIFPITIDSGFEGPQAILNNIDDFCSMADIEAYSFTNKIDAESIIDEYLVRPGFRILSTGQRLLQSETLHLSLIEKDKTCRYFKYKEGKDVTIVCFNHAIPYGLELSSKLNSNRISSSLFSINTHSEFDITGLLNDIQKTKNLVLIDDSRSRNPVLKDFLLKINKSCNLDKEIILTRSIEERLTKPYEDKMNLDYNNVVSTLLLSKKNNKKI